MFWKETQNHPIPQMMMTLKEIFRGENNLWWNCIPLAYQTKSWIPKRRRISQILCHLCRMEKQEMVFLYISTTSERQVL